MMQPIKSLDELRAKAATDPEYDALAVVASSNLGGPRDTLEKALEFLGDCTDVPGEKWVVEEVNYVIDMVPEELERIRRGKI